NIKVQSKFISCVILIHDGTCSKSFRMSRLKPLGRQQMKSFSPEAEDNIKLSCVWPCRNIPFRM
ncbi:hypothetical protein BgiBS90_006882, partial [Biomphalaria glabrata]